MKASRQRAAQSYLVLLYLDFALNSAKAFFLVPIYLRYIDARLFGSWLASGDIVATMAILDLGSGLVVLQTVAAAYGRDQREDLSYIIGTGFWTLTCLSFLPLVIGLIGSSYVPSFLKIGGPEAKELTTAIVIASGAAGLQIFASAPMSVLKGLQKIVLSGCVQLLGLIIGIAVTIFLLVEGCGLVAIPLGSLATSAFFHAGRFCSDGCRREDPFGCSSVSLSESGAQRPLRMDFHGFSRRPRLQHKCQNP